MSSSISAGAAPGAGRVPGHASDALTRAAQTGRKSTVDDFFTASGQIYRGPVSWWYDPANE